MESDGRTKVIDALDCDPIKSSESLMDVPDWAAVICELRMR